MGLVFRSVAIVVGVRVVADAIAVSVEPFRRPTRRVSAVPR
jgi:hypothetical protein